MRWLLIKDLQVLRRSPLITALLVFYPVLLAVLIGFALSRGPEKPKVAFVNEGASSGQRINLGGRQIGVNRYAKQLFQNIDPVRVPTRQAAIDAVRSGDVLGALVVPPDLAQKLSTQVERPTVEVFVNEEDPLKARYVDQVISSQVARANSALSRLLTTEAVSYIDLLIKGGGITVFGQRLDILGLERVERSTTRALKQLPPGSPAHRQLAAVAKFARLARANLDVSAPLLRTLSEPIAVQKVSISGTAPPLSSFASAVAVSFSLMFVTLLLAAGALALEREENTFQRLVRGPISRTRLVVEKTAMAQICALVVAVLLLVVLGLFISLKWSRFPLWIVTSAFGAGAFAAMGVALGGVAREVRAASLLTVMLSFPVAFLGLIPSGTLGSGLYAVVRGVSALFPFKPTLDAMNAALYGGADMALPLVHLAVLAAAYGVLARFAVKRLG